MRKKLNITLLLIIVILSSTTFMWIVANDQKSNIFIKPVKPTLVVNNIATSSSLISSNEQMPHVTNVENKGTGATVVRVSLKEALFYSQGDYYARDTNGNIVNNGSSNVNDDAIKFIGKYRTSSSFIYKDRLQYYFEQDKFNTLGYNDVFYDNTTLPVLLNPTDFDAWTPATFTDGTTSPMVITANYIIHVKYFQTNANERVYVGYITISDSGYAQQIALTGEASDGSFIQDDTSIGLTDINFPSNSYFYYGQKVNRPNTTSSAIYLEHYGNTYPYDKPFTYSWANHNNELYDFMDNKDNVLKNYYPNVISGKSVLPYSANPATNNEYYFDKLLNAPVFKYHDATKDNFHRSKDYFLQDVKGKYYVPLTLDSNLLLEFTNVTTDISTFGVNKPWYYNENDGYFYYYKLLAPGESTSNFTNKISLTDSVIEDHNGLRLKLDIYAEGGSSLLSFVEEYYGVASGTPLHTYFDGILN